MRYRLSCTTCGACGRMTGNANKYAFLAIGRMILNVITLGYLIPESDIVKQEFLMRDMYLVVTKRNLQVIAMG